ncbi:MAG: STAS domain-containing protein [Pseudomonadota bacterium]|nr:STAS domain-containing protein [Pseudomonadota bacterium]
MRQQSNGAELKQAGEGRLTLCGSLDFDTVASLRPLLRRYLRPGEAVSVNLKRVGRCNSAGLALLLQWVEDARGQGSTIQYRNLPHSLTEIADLYDLKSLIPVV